MNSVGRRSPEEAPCRRRLLYRSCVWAFGYRLVMASLRSGEQKIRVLPWHDIHRSNEFHRGEPSMSLDNLGVTILLHRTWMHIRCDCTFPHTLRAFRVVSPESRFTSASGPAIALVNRPPLVHGRSSFTYLRSWVDGWTGR